MQVWKDAEMLVLMPKTHLSHPSAGRDLHVFGVAQGPQGWAKNGVVGDDTQAFLLLPHRFSPLLPVSLSLAIDIADIGRGGAWGSG